MNAGVDVRETEVRCVTSSNRSSQSQRKEVAQHTNLPFVGGFNGDYFVVSDGVLNLGKKPTLVHCPPPNPNPNPKAWKAPPQKCGERAKLRWAVVGLRCSLIVTDRAIRQPLAKLSLNFLEGPSRPSQNTNTFSLDIRYINTTSTMIRRQARQRMCSSHSHSTRF